jgi:hypothetical protein
VRAVVILTHIRDSDNNTEICVVSDASFAIQIVMSSAHKHLFCGLFVTVYPRFRLRNLNEKQTRNKVCGTICGTLAGSCPKESWHASHFVYILLFSTP